jgi:hypothetical protein
LEEIALMAGTPLVMNSLTGHERKRAVTLAMELVSHLSGADDSPEVLACALYVFIATTCRAWAVEGREEQWFDDMTRGAKEIFEKARD